MTSFSAVPAHLACALCRMVPPSESNIASNPPRHVCPPRAACRRQVSRRLGSGFDARVHAHAAAVCAWLAGPEGLGSGGAEDRRAACGALGAAMRAAPTAMYEHVQVGARMAGVQRCVCLACLLHGMISAAMYERNGNGERWGCCKHARCSMVQSQTGWNLCGTRRTVAGLQPTAAFTTVTQ